MTIAQLRTFLAILDAGTFSGAAVRLTMSQSAVSHALASLERELGGPVLSRGPGQPVSSTELGRLLEPEARELVERADRIETTAGSYLGLERGRIRIASVASIAGTHLPPLLSRFRARYPRIEVAVLEGSDREVHDWLIGGVADVGFLAVPLDGLATAPFVEDALLALVRADHRLATSEAVTVGDFAGESFITTTGGCEPLVLDWFGDRPPRMEYSVRGIDTMISFVREGLGVSVVPELNLPSDTSGLVLRPLDPPATRSVVVAWSGERESTPVVAAFVRAASRTPTGQLPGASRSP
jgi:DNA-binding transcriptional LysR family regulator